MLPPTSKGASVVQNDPYLAELNVFVYLQNPNMSYSIVQLITIKYSESLASSKSELPLLRKICKMTQSLSGLFSQNGCLNLNDNFTTVYIYTHARAHTHTHTYTHTLIQNSRAAVFKIMHLYLKIPNSNFD